MSENTIIPTKACVKYAIVCWVIQRTDVGLTLSESIQQATTVIWPDSGGKRYAFRSIEEMYYDYVNGGIAGLIPQLRSDNGCYRTISADLGDWLLERARKFSPETLPSKDLYNEWSKDASVPLGSKARFPSLSTVRRFLTSQGGYSKKDDATKSQHNAILIQREQEYDKFLVRFLAVNWILERCLVYGETLSDALRNASDRRWPMITGSTISRRTLEDWYYLFKNKGIEGIKDKPRSGRGESRAVPVEMQEWLIGQAKTSPGVPYTVLFAASRLRDRFPSITGIPALQSVRRFLRVQFQIPLIMASEAQIFENIPCTFPIMLKLGRHEDSKFTNHACPNRRRYV